MSPTPMAPPNSSVMGGSTRIWRPAAVASSHSSRSSSELAPGMAMTTVSASWSVAAVASAVRPPMTRSPMIRRFRLAGSSSRMATGR